MYSDLIYDFDGTLSDTYPVVTEEFLRILREHGIREEYDRAYAYLKRSYGYAVKQYDIGMEAKAFSALLNERVIRASVRQKPIAGALELLRAAAERGKRNFIYTHSGAYVHGIMERWGFAPYVTYVLDSSHGFPRKPDPAALRYLTERFSIDPAKVLMVGDRDIDIEVGHNAGMAGCLLDPEGFYTDCVAEYRVCTLPEIQKIL